MSHQKDKQPKEKDKLYLIKIKNVFQGTSSRNWKKDPHNGKNIYK